MGSLLSLLLLVGFVLFLAHLFTGSDAFSELQCNAGVCFQLSTFHGLRNLSSVRHTWALSTRSSELQGNHCLQCLLNLWILHSYFSFSSSLLPAFSLFPLLPLRTLLMFLPTLLCAFKEKKNCKSSLSINFKFYIPRVRVSARSLVYNIFVLLFRVKFSLIILTK